MNRFRIRAIAVVGIVVATVIVFIDYFATHASVRHQLHHTSLATLALLLLLYLGTMVALALINASTLRLCQVSLGSSENLLLTAYTAVINFFGPLQSGPAFRAVYLKQKYKINFKNYALATFVYYFFYVAFSVLFLLF